MVPHPNAATALLLVLLQYLCSGVEAEGENCTLCPGGFEFPDEVFDATTGQTCHEANDATTHVETNSVECQSALSDVFGSSGYPSECGYCLPSDLDRCWLCEDGSQPTLPAGTVIASGVWGGLTCGELVVLAYGESSGTENCIIAQGAAPLCSCSDPGFGAGSADETCSLCQDGTPVSDPGVLSMWAGESCGDLEFAAAVFFSADSEECRGLQSVGALDCGCPLLVNASGCSLCADRSPVSDPSKFSEFANVTCGQLDAGASFLSADSEDCAGVQFVGVLDCGCPPGSPRTEDPCILCADKSPVPDPNTNSPSVEVSCGDLEATAAAFFSADSEDCLSFQFLGATECGCPALENPSGCSLCADKSPVSDPSKVSEFADFSCGELEVSASFLSADSEDCAGIQFVGVLDCGCSPGSPRTEDSCVLCADESPVPDPNATSPSFDMSCGDLEVTAAAFFSANDEDCLGLQFLGSAECGCAGLKNGCSLCPDGGSVRDPSLFSVLTNITCGQLESGTSIYPPNGEECAGIQLVGVLDCGCSLEPGSEDSCSLCHDGSPVPDQDKYSSLADATCGQLEAYVTHFFMSGSMECSDIQALGILDCDCPALENGCSLCSDGEPVLDPGQLSTLTNVTCGQLESSASFFGADGEDCAGVQIVGMVDCGCAPVHAREGSCSLCADGSPVPDPDKYSKLAGASCRQLEAYSNHLILVGSDECSEIQSLGILECGCPALEDGCSLCADGALAPDPENFFFDGNTTCGELEAYLSAVPRQSEICTGSQIAGFVFCGCAYVAPVSTVCPLCSDGSLLPDPTKILFRDDFDISCGIVEWEFASLDDSAILKAECDAAQATIGAACGCADPPPPACDVCTPGEFFDFLKPIEDSFFDDDLGDQIACGSVLYELSVNSSLCVDFLRADLAKDCCIANESVTKASSPSSVEIIKSAAPPQSPSETIQLSSRSGAVNSARIYFFVVSTVTFVFSILQA